MCDDGDVFNVLHGHKCTTCGHTWISDVFDGSCPECSSIFVVPKLKW